MKTANSAKITGKAKLDPRSSTFAREFKVLALSHRKRVSNSREQALASLVEAGICTPNGRLTKNYR